MSLAPEFKVVFQPSGRMVYVLADTTVFEAAARAGLMLQTPCGGRGSCGKCRVRVVAGDVAPSAACRQFFSAAELQQGMRLGCQVRLVSDAVIDVPAASLYESAAARILTDGQAHDLHVQAMVEKTWVQLAAPTMADPAADLMRLERVLGPLRIKLSLLRQLPAKLRANNYGGTAVVCNGDLLDFEPGDTTSSSFGVAFDLGTTTIVAVLLDLNSGAEIGVAATMNPQVNNGDDVISRICAARDSQANITAMQDAVIQACNALIRQLSRDHGVQPRHIYEVTIAGNTTMQHLFCGITPAALGEMPFAPAFSRALVLWACEAGIRLEVNEHARLYVFPNIGGFIGGDTVAGILATGLWDCKDTVLLVDIGTNGEIALLHQGKISTASAAAGPAFEGARIVNGMRATSGAIEKVVFNGNDLQMNVIGNALPIGMCGTALIDLVAELLRLEVIDCTGRIVTADEVPQLPEAIRQRLHEADAQVNVLLCSAADSGTGEALYLYQKDVRELQLASGAIRAGINIMLSRLNLTADDLDSVLLAGGFGNFIRRRNACRIGLLPALPLARIRFVGNAASAGAKAALVSRKLRAIAEQVATAAEHVDLSMDAEFQMEFAMAMMFPQQ